VAQLSPRQPSQPSSHALLRAPVVRPSAKVQRPSWVSRGPPNKELKLTKEAPKRETADRRGIVVFSNLPSGLYDPCAKNPGFETTVVLSCSESCETRIVLTVRVDMRHAETVT